MYVDDLFDAICGTFGVIFFIMQLFSVEVFKIKVCQHQKHSNWFKV